MEKNIRIIYMGTPELSAHILKGLIEAGYPIVAVIAQEDKPVGRKGLIVPVPTKAIAMEYGIPVFQPHRIREDYDFVKELKPDLIVTCAYGQIVPQGLLDIPPLGCINVHGSLLPKYRGASPIQQSLINGDAETGVTIMEMIDRMDAGDMLLKETFPIEKEDNYTTLCKKISASGLSALLRALPVIIDGTAVKIPQNEAEATFCSKIKKEQEHLDVSLSAEEFVRWVRALSETPGGYVLLEDQVFKIFRAEPVEGDFGEAGKIVRADRNGLYLSVSSGAVALLEVQKQGKKRMDYRSFINGEKNLLGKSVR